jgi:hypothetical protein
MKECAYVYHVLFIKTELGVEYVSHSDSMDEGREVFHPSNVMDWEEKDRNFQASGTIP